MGVEPHYSRGAEAERATGRGGGQRMEGSSMELRQGRL